MKKVFKKHAKSFAGILGFLIMYIYNEYTMTLHTCKYASAIPIESHAGFTNFLIMARMLDFIKLVLPMPLVSVSSVQTVYAEM